MRHIFGAHRDLTDQEINQVNGGQPCSGRPPFTTQAIGEEGGNMTTMALGEEGGYTTTLAVGEEGGDRYTTLAVGEEGGSF